MNILYVDVYVGESIHFRFCRNVISYTQGEALLWIILMDMRSIAVFVEKEVT